jgi:outer membrane protein
MLHKFFLVATTLVGTTFAADSGMIGAVNFATCVAESKAGKKEQENMENIRKQMSSLIEKTEKELKELAAKFEDTEFLDSLSPKAEEELKLKYQTLEEDLGRYQNQFYQVLQHAQYQMVQKISSHIAKASETIAGEKKLDYVLNKEACFFIRPTLDLTNSIVIEMDKNFEIQMKDKKLSDNTEQPLDLKALDESAAHKAG